MPHVFSGWGAVHHQCPAKRDGGVSVRWDCWAFAGGLGGGGAHMPPPGYFGQWTELLSWIFHSFIQSSAPTEIFLGH